MPLSCPQCKCSTTWSCSFTPIVHFHSLKRNFHPLCFGIACDFLYHALKMPKIRKSVITSKSPCISILWRALDILAAVFQDHPSDHCFWGLPAFARVPWMPGTGSAAPQSVCSRYSVDTISYTLRTRRMGPSVFSQCLPLCLVYSEH